MFHMGCTILLRLDVQVFGGGQDMGSVLEAKRILEM